MMYQGSEAYAFDVDDFAQRPLEQERHAPFGLVRGEGRDAAERRGVSLNFAKAVCTAAVVLLVFVGLAIGRIYLSVLATSRMAANDSLVSAIETTTASNVDLGIARSSLSSATRIDRIATQNYGMVIPASSESLTVGASSAEDNVEASSDEATDAQEGEVTQSQQ